MKIRFLKDRGLKVIEYQRNICTYSDKTLIQKRSYICFVVDNDIFVRCIEPYLSAYGVRYITQTNSAWDISGMKGKEVWVRKRNGKGTTKIELLDETIEIGDKEVYVVMWYKRFLPTFMRTGTLYDVDYILHLILHGKTKPMWQPFRFLLSMLI